MPSKIKDVATTQGQERTITPSVMDLIAEASRNPDYDVDKMERLFALKLQVDEGNARQAYMDALRQFRRDCPAITKNTAVPGKNKNTGQMFTKYKFAPLDDIQAIIEPHLEANGLEIQFDTERMDGQEYVVCVVMHEQGHKERSRQPLIKVDIPGGNQALNLGGGTTFARRYALIGALNLKIVGEDRNTEPPVPLSDSQLADLKALMHEILEAEAPDGETKTQLGARGKAMLKSTLDYGGVESLEQFPAAKFSRYCKVLRNRGRSGE